jgi:hypothetical protein
MKTEPSPERQPAGLAMLKTIALVAVVALAALLIYAATRPGTLRVERSTRIQASPEKVHALINDLHAFNTWNPYNQKDPAIQLVYGGPAAGPGASFTFDGNRNVGKGSIEITGTRAPTEVQMKLHMSSPMEGHNDIRFSLVPEGAATQVTWAMQCEAPFVSKLVGIFIDMDNMIGKDFAAGLANLKTVAERA